MYLGLNHRDIIELPEGIHRLKALQTFNIRWCGCLTALSDEILNLVRLRHLKMFKSMFQDVRGMAEELGNLIQLRRLGVMDVAEENISELFASITKMPGLLSLSLEAKHAFDKGNLILLDSFSPPPFLQKLLLEGVLEKLPTSFGSLERLTTLRLGNSHMSENS
ncbi:hypothetical protein CerSpe_187690 [Prunus speciosa]